MIWDWIFCQNNPNPLKGFQILSPNPKSEDFLDFLDPSVQSFQPLLTTDFKQAIGQICWPSLKVPVVADAAYSSSPCSDAAGSTRPGWSCRRRSCSVGEAVRCQSARCWTRGSPPPPALVCPGHHLAENTENWREIFTERPLVKMSKCVFETTELAKKVFPRWRKLAPAARGGITQPRT